METQTEVQEEKTIKWRKTGGGSLRFPVRGADGKAKQKIIKPNEVFSAKQSEIPESFRDIVVPVDTTQVGVGGEPPIEPEAGVFELKERGDGWYDVVNSVGKVLNEKALKKEEAERVVKSLAS